jgi:hypothetical protein
MQPPCRPVQHGRLRVHERQGERMVGGGRERAGRIGVEWDRDARVGRADGLMGGGSQSPNEESRGGGSLAERGGSSGAPEAREAGSGGSGSVRLGGSAGALPMATTAGRRPA